MILGRNAGLWAGLSQAAINVVALGLVVATGHPLTADVLALFAGVNALGAVLVAIVANESDPTTVPTLAPTLSERRGTGETAPLSAAPYAGPDRRNGNPQG